MKHMPQKWWHTAWQVLLLLPLLGGALLSPVIALLLSLQWHARTADQGLARLMRQVQVGQTEPQVQHLLGAPQASYLPADMGQDFPLEGATWDGHRITGKVLVYDGGGELHAYLYLGRDGRVEHVARAYHHLD